MSQIVAWIAVLIAELVVCAMDVVAAFSYMFTGGTRISTATYAVVCISLICDPVSFILAVPRPKAGSTLLAVSAIASLLAAVCGYFTYPERSNLLRAIVFASLFWSPKLLLSFYFVQRSRLSSWRLAFGGTARMD